MADPESLNCFISEVVSCAVSETASALFAPIGIQPKCIHCGEGGKFALYQGLRSRGGWGGFSPPNNFPKFDLKKLNIVILKIMWLHTLLIMQWS